MPIPRTLLAAQAALGLALPLSIGASQAATPSEPGTDQVSTISQFADVRPGDWAYQALALLSERHGCMAGYPDGRFSGGGAITRYEAAALLNACLDRITEQTDALRRLLKEFERELSVLKGQVDGVEARVGELEATRFSTTTKLSGQATYVLGGNAFGGSAAELTRIRAEDFGAVSLNYDLQLSIDTSFAGRDLLRLILRAGNFSSLTNSFGGGGPSRLSQLEVAFQENLDDPDGLGRDFLSIDRLFYQWPMGDFTLTVGTRVGQEDMLAIWPSVYPSETVLDVLTLGGAPAAYNKNLAPGAGLWWRRNGFAASASYIAANGNEGNPETGGIGTSNSGSTGTVQAGYSASNWGITAIWNYIQNGSNVINYATDFTLISFSNPGDTTALGLSGYWQPLKPGLIPSISLGWGLNSTRYGPSVAADGLVATSQSWSIGLEWKDLLQTGNALGMAVGQPTFATRLYGDTSPEDGNYVWEGWYRLQLTDAISVTPAIFYLSRPLGQLTPSGESFSQVGALIKTSFRF